MRRVTLRVDDAFLPRLKEVLADFSDDQVFIEDDHLRAEIKRRIEEIKANPSTLISHKEIMKKIYNR